MVYVPASASGTEAKARPREYSGEAPRRARRVRDVMRPPAGPGGEWRMAMWMGRSGSGVERRRVMGEGDGRERVNCGLRR